MDQPVDAVFPGPLGLRRSGPCQKRGHGFAAALGISGKPSLSSGEEGGVKLKTVLSVRQAQKLVGQLNRGL
jgi:hypothetical protein